MNCVLANRTFNLLETELLSFQLFPISVHDIMFTKKETFFILLMLKACVVCRDDNDGRIKEKCDREPLFKGVLSHI